MCNRCRHPTLKVNIEGRWSPPQGVLKINMNDPSHGNPGHAGIDVVGQYISRDFYFILSIYMGLHTNNLMEARAILLALECASKLRWHRIIWESDSQVVVNLLNRWHLYGVSWHLALIVD